MERLKLFSSSAEETWRLGACLAAFLQPGDVVALTGDLGAGKTRLVQGVAEGLGVGEKITSPTFGLLAVHEGRLELNHFDLYRLEHEDQLYDVDFWGTLESGGVAFVEWGDRFPGAIPEEHLTVRIVLSGENERSLDLLPYGRRGHQLAERWWAACRQEDRR